MSRGAGHRVELPAGFERTIREALGPRGDAWLRQLPRLVASLAARWRIEVGRPFALSYNYVARVRRADGTEAVLKVGPWHEELRREIEALRLYDGTGACRLLEADADQAALLLERLRPGQRLAEIAATDDDRATQIGAEVMLTLWRPAAALPDPPRFRPLAEWFRAFDRHRAAYGGAWPFPAPLLERAEALAAELLASAPREVLLHGDFHHDNVLASDRAGWLAIDPKGMLGDPGYEIGPFLLNPDPTHTVHPPTVLRRRLDVLAELLGYDRERLRCWAIAHAVLSACWSIEDRGNGWQPAMASAENLIGL